MQVIKSTFFPLEPQAAIRSTQTQSWLTQKTEEEAQKIESSYSMGFKRNGQPYWYKIDAKGKMKTYSSKPNFVRTKRYLDKYIAYKDELRFLAQKMGFIMPQDAFFMWFFMPMPKSWTKKKKAEMAFKLHKNKKDTDNLSKAIKDALAPRKNNFIQPNLKEKVMDDRVISSYANAKIYVPDEYSNGVGTLIIEYDIKEFLQPFFNDAAKIMNFKI